MSRNDNTGLGLASLFVIGALVIISAGVSEAAEFEDTITVEKTWTKMQCDGDGNCSEKYLVRSTSGEVFQITDSLYRAQFRSSDIWSDMDPGETFKIKGDGYRFGCTSSCRRIYSVEAVK